jgi:iron complex transport system substrate-binding protein
MRIVSLLSSATEMLFALGLGEQVVAISHECDYPAEATRLPRATRSRIDSTQPSGEIDRQVKRLLEAGEPLYEIDGELIRRLAPGLIVTQAQCDVCAVRYQDVIDFVAAEPALAATKVVALNPQTVGEILEDIVRVGEAAGVAGAAREFVKALQTRVERVSANDGTRSVPTTVVCLEWLAPLMTAGNWTPELIELAGGESCLAERGKHSGYVEWEAVRDCDPDVLLVAPCGFDLARSELEARQLWQLAGFGELKAVQTARAYVIDGNAYLNRSGPRIVDSLEILAHLIQPDRFGPPDVGRASCLPYSRLDFQGRPEAYPKTKTTP